VLAPVCEEVKAMGTTVAVGDRTIVSARGTAEGGGTLKGAQWERGG